MRACGLEILAMLIENRSPPKRPVVSVTAPASSKQVRIAFNAPLVREASLQDVPYMAIDFDEERQRVTFISAPSHEYNGKGAFPLMRDGGQSSSKTASKALYGPKNLLSKLHLQAPRMYKPEIQRGRAGTKISIALEPAPASYAAPEEIPLRVGGIYRVLDADGTDIDIGCSKNDVRGRVSTKWRHEKEAASVLVYALESELDCLHWERVFQRRFEAASGRLPRYCEVRGKGCGCKACS
jgi:hypothetical protein